MTVLDWLHPKWLTDIGLTIDQLTAGSNAIWQVGAFLTLAVMATGLRKVGRQLRRATVVQAVGVMLIAIGAFTHRGYWNLSIFNRYGEAAYAEWAADLRLFPASQTLLIMIGTLMALSNFGSLYMGRARWWALVVVSYTVWVGYSVHLAG